MATSSKLKIAHELSRDPHGRGKSGKRLLGAAAVIGLVVVFILFRKSAAAGSTGTGSYYDAAGNLYDANGNLLVPASGTTTDAGTASGDQFSQLSDQLDLLQSTVDAWIAAGQTPPPTPSTTAPPSPPGTQPPSPSEPPPPPAATAPPKTKPPGYLGPPEKYVPPGTVKTSLTPAPNSTAAGEGSAIFRALPTATLPAHFVDATDHVINQKGFRVGGAADTSK